MNEFLAEEVSRAIAVQDAVWKRQRSHAIGAAKQNGLSLAVLQQGLEVLGERELKDVAAFICRLYVQAKDRGTAFTASEAQAEFQRNADEISASLAADLVSVYTAWGSINGHMIEGARTNLRAKLASSIQWIGAETYEKIAEKIGTHEVGAPPLLESQSTGAVQLPTRATAASKRVMTLHGIRTYGEWQKEIAEPLAEAGFVPKALGYGYFRAWRLLLEQTRKNQVEWFRKKYDDVVRPGDPLPHIIAHSFGTYIVAEAMRKYPEVRFDQIIFCGSIVERDFPWPPIRARKQYQRLLNETGGKDTPVKLVGHVVKDAGGSGTGKGFTQIDESVAQNENVHFAHSDVLYAARVTRLWVPFLRGEPFVPDSQVPSAAPNASFRRTARLVILFILVGVFALLLFRHFSGPPFAGPHAADATVGSTERFRLSTEAMTVFDAKTYYRWTTSDSRAKHDYAFVTRYCTSLGEGWHVPTFEELDTIKTTYDKSDDNISPERASCHSGYDCWIPRVFSLSGPVVWMSSRTSAPQNEGFNFEMLFSREAVPPSAGLPTLCVKEDLSGREER